jgi:MFS family permease
MPGLLSKERIIAPPSFNRWLVPPASVAIHLCIGSVYAWSVYNPALIRVFGVVTPAAEDWLLSNVVWIFSVAIVFLGLSAAVAGKWLEDVGPRMVGTVAAACWGGGYLIGGLGIYLHELWLVYLGYGAIGGCGLGLGYVSPVSTLIRWFPDRRGMATGMAIMGFGGGAIIGTPLKRFFIRLFYEQPEYLGPVDQVSLVTEGGRRFAQMAGELREVVVVGANDVSGMIVRGAEGVYAVGTGNVGVAETFVTLGLIYFVVMLAAAFSYRVPPPGWKPAGWSPPDEAHRAKRMISTSNVHINEALKTRQFYQLWIVLCFNVTAGIGVLGVAQTMMSEIFGTTLPNIVDGAFAATYVSMIGLFNMLGRFFWASSSDYIGRRNTPVAITMLRERAIGSAIRDLVGKVDPARFEAAFGAGIEQLDALVAQQTVTIAKLMEIAPPGTVDPTPGVYNLTMYVMAGLLAIALVANALMAPVAAKHHMRDAQLASVG